MVCTAPSRPQPDCGLPRQPAIDPLWLGQIPARAWISGHAPVRCRCGLCDLPSGAEAFVRAIRHLDNCVLVGGQPLRLHHRLAVESDSQSDEVGKLLAGQSRSNSRRVEVLDPQQEPAARRSREKPGKQRRT
jgi:hypothetical protein